MSDEKALKGVFRSSLTGKYLTSNNQGQVEAKAHSSGPDEQWVLKGQALVHKGVMRIKSEKYNLYLHSSYDGKVATGPNDQDWEKWITLSLFNSQHELYLESKYHGGRYLSSTSDGDVSTKRKLEQQETWVFIARGKEETNQIISTDPEEQP